MRSLRRAARVATSSLVAFEVLRGTRSSREERAADELFDLVPPLELALPVAQTAAEIARTNPGVLLGDRAALDALIAGTALAEGLTLITLNTRQFARLKVPGLRLLLIDQQARDWAAQVT
jgi:predicted nucleic acid-binding protein